jgi:DNA-binding transcriptional ArsR family regulator
MLPSSSNSGRQHPLGANDAERIARALSRGRRISRNRDGWKSYCPLCDRTNGKQMVQPTLSVTIRDGKPLLHCHRCRSTGVELIRALVGRGILPDTFKRSSRALALADGVERAAATMPWNGIAASTDLSVLLFLAELTRRSGKPDIGIAVRTLAEHARVAPSTASNSLNRLARAGWIGLVRRAKGEAASIWRIQVPVGGLDRTRTLLHDQRTCDRLSTVDPCYPGGSRAGSFRSAPPFDHDLFRTRGLGKSKGRIYTLLADPMTARQIAEALGYKDARNVRIHLLALAGKHLISRLADGRYERCKADLDAMAEGLGVKGASERQRARHVTERANFKRWRDAFEHWRRCGEIIDAESGEILAYQPIPSKHSRMHSFRRLVLLIRMTRSGVGDRNPDDQHQSR